MRRGWSLPSTTPWSVYVTPGAQGSKYTTQDVNNLLDRTKEWLEKEPPERATLPLDSVTTHAAVIQNAGGVPWYLKGTATAVGRSRCHRHHRHRAPRTVAAGFFWTVTNRKSSSPSWQRLWFLRRNPGRSPVPANGATHRRRRLGVHATYNIAPTDVGSHRPGPCRLLPLWCAGFSNAHWGATDQTPSRLPAKGPQ